MKLHDRLSKRKLPDVPVSVRVPDDLFCWLIQMSKRYDVTVSAVIIACFEEMREQYKDSFK